MKKSIKTISGQAILGFELFISSGKKQDTVLSENDKPFR